MASPLFILRRASIFLCAAPPFLISHSIEAFNHNQGAATPYGPPPFPIKRRCEITIISFSRSICRGGLAALIGVTGKPYPSCLSYHSHPIRPCGAPSPREEGCDTRIPSSKKRRRSRHLNPEPNESKVKRSCEEMRIHFFTAPFVQVVR